MASQKQECCNHFSWEETLFQYKQKECKRKDYPLKISYYYSVLFPEQMQ